MDISRKRTPNWIIQFSDRFDTDILQIERKRERQQERKTDRRTETQTDR